MNNQLPDLYGFNPCSEAGLDVFAPSIFVAGCNLRCPYCMNSGLVKCRDIEKIDIEKIKEYVKKEACDFVMISGGEPTCLSLEHLCNLLNEIRSWGCKVGISTNGTNFQTLGQVIDLLNYVALDLKTPSYKEYTSIGFGCALFNVIQSRSLIAEEALSREDFKYELRTTLYPPFIDKKTIKEIAGIVNRRDTWFLQQFRHAKNMLDASCCEIKPYNEEEVEEIANIARKYCDNVHVRYV